MDYNMRAHREGRIWTAIAIAVMALLPIGACLIMGATPDWKIFGVSFVLLIYYLPTQIGEVFTYSYMLGTSGTYLAFITGNLSNLKIPCVINSIDIVGTKVGTEENEIVSTISIAVSAIVTVVIIAIGVLLLAVSGLADVINSAGFLDPAFNCVAFALFGALGGKYIVKYTKIAIIPFFLLAAICVGLMYIPATSGMVATSYMLFVGVIFAVINAYIIYFKKTKEQQTIVNAIDGYADGLKEQESVVSQDGLNVAQDNIASEKNGLSNIEAENLVE